MKEEEKKDTKVDEEDCDDFSFTDMMVCSNCKYYDPETNSCKLKSTDFHKFSVNPNNHCIDWEQDDSLNIAYNLIYKILDKYMDMDDKNKRIVSLWVLGANIHNSFQSYPYLFINAMKGSGKTRLLKIIASLTNGDILASLTEAVLFRTKGTLCIDEFEGITRKGNENLRELLNTAYKKGTKVKRMIKKKVLGGEEQVVEEFEPYRPIAIANISGMEEVLNDRCINVIIEKSDNQAKTRLTEVWDHEFEFKEFKKAINKCSLCSLCKCSFVFRIYLKWNNFIYTNNTNNTNYTIYTNYINNTNYTNYTTNNKEVIDYDYLFNLIKDSSLDGRFLELGMPLFLTAYFVDKNLLPTIIKDFENIVESKKEENLIENSDISLYDFLNQEPETDNYIFISELTNRFRQFLGYNENRENDWCNERWMGRALKRLNLIKEKRRFGRGINVKIDFEKAKEKMKMFKD